MPLKIIREAGNGMKKFVFTVIAFPLLIIALISAPLHVRGERDTEFRSRNALANYREGDYKGALQLVREYISQDPKNVEKKHSAVKLLLEMAIESHQTKRDAEALELLKEARSLEDNEQVKELLQAIEEERISSPEVIPAEMTSVAEVSAPEDVFFFNNWIGRPPGQEQPGNTAAPPVGRKGARQAPASHPRLRGPRAPLPDTHASNDLPAPVRSPAKTLPATPAPHAVTDRALILIAAIVTALIALLTGAGLLYLRRIHKRMLLQSSSKLQEALQDMQSEKMRIKENEERMLKTLEERISRENDRMEAEERRRREDWELKEKARREEEKAERERSKPETAPEEKSGPLTRGENAPSEEEPPKTQPGAKDISEALLSIDAQESARQAAYQNLSSRLLAYKRFGVQLSSIYELDKEKALDFIKPLLNDPDPHVRAYLAGGLAQLPTPEFADTLLQLWEDTDTNVREESLRGLANFHKRHDLNGSFPEHLQTRIKQLVEQEKRNSDWIL